MSFDYDLIVIGSGPAGFSCAMQGSKFEKKVLVVETKADQLGGTWINTGTVPSKALREAAKTIYRYHTQFGNEKRQRPFEIFKMEDLLRYKQEILESKNRKVKEDLLKNEIDTIGGFGELVDKHTVEVTDKSGGVKTYSARYILVSTGSSPNPPSKKLYSDSEILNYESILDLTHIPRRLVIMGGGINAFEYATVFGALGARVSILNEMEDYLVYLDHEIREQLHESLAKRQITVYNDAKVTKIRNNDLRNCTEVCFKSRDQDRVQVIETEHVLYFGKYQPNSEKIGLDKLGIRVDKDGFIPVDNHYQTPCEPVYAAGDVIGFPTLASVSFVQGRLAACNMFGIPSRELQTDIPFGIYTLPEIAGIGLTEHDAGKLNLDVTVGRAYYSNVTQADISHQNEGILKLIFSTKNLKLLGVHIFGEGATDLIHLGLSVMANDGDIRYFFQHVINYPSYTEAYRIAAFNGVNRVNKTGIKYRNILVNSGETND
ncbi:MAG: FAD-dependent oxidoreductase [Balneolaceae bacterium]